MTRLVAVSAGESAHSKTRALAAAAIELHGAGELIDLSALGASGLLGREPDEMVTAAVESASSADVLVAATPIYRATYSGVLKAFFDRFAYNSLSRTAVVLVATAAAPQHFLAVDTGLRALIASLAGWSVPKIVYATGDDFEDGEPSEDIRTSLRDAVEQATRIAAAITRS